MEAGGCERVNYLVNIERKRRGEKRIFMHTKPYTECVAQLNNVCTAIMCALHTARSSAQIHHCPWGIVDVAYMTRPLATEKVWMF